MCETGAFGDQTSTFVDQTGVYEDIKGPYDEQSYGFGNQTAADFVKQTASLANRTMSPTKSLGSNEGGFDLMTFARKFPHGGDSM